MSEKIEKLLLVVMLVGGVVVLVGEAVNGSWLRVALWVVVLSALAFLNRRLLVRSTPATD